MIIYTPTYYNRRRRRIKRLESYLASKNGPVMTIKPPKPP